MALNTIASDCLINIIDGGPIDATPIGTPVTVKAKAKRIQKDDDIVEINCKGIGDASARFRPGSSKYMLVIDLLIGKASGAIAVTLGNYLKWEFATDAALTPASDSGMVKGNSIEVNDEQETIQRITVIGPADQ